MSISKPQEQRKKNPAVKFITWKSGMDQGYAVYFDKDSKENIKVDMSEFAVLDQDLFCLSGYDEANKRNLKSNEVRGNNDLLTVRWHKDGKSYTHLSGTYNELKEQVLSSRELSRAKCMYILLDGEVCRLSISGSTYAAWINHIEKAKHADNGWVGITGTEAGKKGAVHWLAPVFSPVRRFLQTDLDMLVKVDAEIIQPYLDSYLKSKADGAEDHSDDEHVSTDNWQSFKSGSTQLGLLSVKEINELASSLINDGMVESAEYANVSAAMTEYQKAELTWADKTDKAGRKISDYSGVELNHILSKIPIDSPTRILVNVALNNLDDEIPF